MKKSIAVSMKIFTLALLSLGNVSAAVNLTDVVYVAAEEPFYINIFETTKADALKAGMDSKYKPGNVNKPDRMNGHEASAYCENIGMKLPSQKEWLLAASNLGNNHTSTLFGDEIENSSVMLANIRSADSLSISEIDIIGIDAIGTVGMTGNRAEWVMNIENGMYQQCGGSYETISASQVTIPNLCVKDESVSNTATARCIYIVEENEEIEVTFSDKIKDNLELYLEKLGITKNIAQGKMLAGILDLLIQPNEYTTLDKKDENLLKMILPEEGK